MSRTTSTARQPGPDRLVTMTSSADDGPAPTSGGTHLDRHETADRLRTQDGRTVGSVASSAGVTVRTLHHWESVGLVVPSARTPSGYRLYDPPDVARVRRVVFYRALGMSLEDIGQVLDGSADQQAQMLRARRAELVAHTSHLQQMVAAVDRLVEAAETGILLTEDEQVEIFGASWQPSWVAEAGERWGGSAQWTEYAERAATMTADDWRAVAGEATGLTDALAAALSSGVAPGTPEAGALAERHRAWIGTYFACSREMQVCLARSYTDDPRYREHYDSLAPGLATWLRQVVEADAQVHGIDPESASWE